MTVKKLFFYFVLLLTPVLFLELVFRILPTAYTPRMMPVNASDPVARYESNVDFKYSDGWNFAIRTTKRSNNYGYFHNADYDSELSTPLLMVIGDSFVQANEVNAGESAAEVLHERAADRARVYSMGLSGAPLSQYLPMAEYARSTFRPDRFVFFIIRNDFDESLYKYKSDARFHYFRKVNEEFALQRVDYRQSQLNGILRKSAFIRYLVLNLEIQDRLQRLAAAFGSNDRQEPTEEELQLAETMRLIDAKAAVDEFLKRVPDATGANAQSVLFVLDGMRPEMYDPQLLADSENGYVANIRKYFIARARQNGYSIIDMQPVFASRHEEDGAKFDFPTDLHWNKLGNELVAEMIFQSEFFETILRNHDQE